MIPVQQKDEPLDFDEKVRQKGVAWLQQHGHPLSGPIPDGVTLHPYWRDCLRDLHAAYEGVCAYVCIYIHPITGFQSVDHFVAKSKNMEMAYEWGNYRLACGMMNGRKHVFEDVLDPFFLEGETFFLELVSGKIYPNPALDPVRLGKAMETIERLDLDNADCRAARTQSFDHYIQKRINGEHLKWESPFVWQEAKRQGLLYD